MCNPDLLYVIGCDANEFIAVFSSNKTTLQGEY